MSISLNEPIICPILIGRKSELTTLNALISQARSTQRQLVLISGEARIGKSRLVAEIKTLAAGLDFLLLQGNCFRSDRFFPYAPLLDLLRTYISAHTATAVQALQPFAPALSHLLPDLALLLPQLSPLEELPHLDPEREQHRLFAVLTRFFTQQARQHPFCS